MQRREFTLAVGSVLGATSIGAVAFTQANVQRDVSVDIVADDAGPITLNPGATPAVTLQNGLLTVDTNTANSNGLNGDGTFTYGNSSTPSSTQAFSMTNNSGASKSVTFGLQNFSLGGSSSITMSIYDSTDTLVGDVTPSSDVTTSLPASDTLYVVLSFDTSGLENGDTMNGQFTINAST